MNELINFATITGIYNGSEIEVVSNEVITILENSLEINKNANKEIWTDGGLIYTIEIKNTVAVNQENVIVTDILNPNLIILNTNSVKINNIPAAYGDFSYNLSTGLLIINIPTILSNETITITFHVKKKHSEIFSLTNYASLEFDKNILNSNTVTVLGLANNCKCRRIQ